jgi:hypothetical protein
MKRHAKSRGGKEAQEPTTLRFELAGAEPQVLYDDARIEALRQQLAALLNLVVLTKDGQYVEVDGFKVVGDLPNPASPVYRIYPAS